MESSSSSPISGSGTSSGDTPAQTLRNLNKDDLLRLQSQGSKRLSFHQNTSARSTVWKKFKVVKVDSVALDFVKCDECNSFLIWKSSQGTSTLARHSCGKQPNCGSTNTTGTRFPNTQLTLHQTGKPQLPSEVVKSLNKKILIGLARDLKPLRSVEGQGFLDIAQAFVNVGAKFGRIEVKKLISHRTTLKKELRPITNTMKMKIKEELSHLLSDPKFAFTMDMWSDKHKQRSFLSFTVHFVDQQFKLQSFMLAVDEFLMESKTTSNIRDECTRILGEYFELDKISEVMEKSKSVTDGGSNMISVFPNRLPCMCHKLNLFLEWTFNDKPLPKSLQMIIQDTENCGDEQRNKKLFRLSERCPKVKGSLAAVKEIVGYFKRSGLNASLKTTLKQDVTTRWNSQLIMLESYLKAESEVKEILCKRNKLDKLMPIDADLLQELVLFLRPFKECSDILSGSKYPTINQVALWFSFLSKHIQPKSSGSTDSEEILALKQQASICFEEYCGGLDVLYYVACMLNPRYRSLKFSSESNKTAAVNALKKLMAEERALSNLVEVVQTPDPEIACRRSRFAEFEDAEEPQLEEDEFEKYIRLRISSKDQENDNFDVMEFWRTSTSFPTLRKVASWVLAIPASQASDERVFSATGGTLTPRRTELSGSTLSDLTFIHVNYPRFESFN